MGGIQHPHWHIHCNSPPSAALTNVTTSSVNVTILLLISLLCMEACVVTQSKRGWGVKGRNLEQFMLGISVIESHSYIKVKKFG